MHGGPFANIAHGNNSIIATRMALKLADYVVTEGGFASDLGAEKFFDIVHGYSGLKPDVAVLVVSVRALNMHGGVSKEDVQITNLDALRKGLANLDKHVENLKKFGLPIVVAINQFPTDEPEELELVRKHSRSLVCAVPYPEWWRRAEQAVRNWPKPYWTCWQPNLRSLDRCTTGSCPSSPSWRSWPRRSTGRMMWSMRQRLNGPLGISPGWAMENCPFVWPKPSIPSLTTLN